MHPVEILSPVGSYESLAAAIQGGCHGVYFGASNLNMRSRSSANFSIEDIQKITSLCHENNTRAYLTLNTVIYDQDIPEVIAVAEAAAQNGCDAIIASDVAVMSVCADKGIPVHASTQLNISNTASVGFFAQYCDVMVLARELDLEQIKGIHAYIVSNNICGPSGKLVRLEAFAHGALCMSVSGKCFLSFHEDRASANRGECFQPCRREYTVFDDRGNELKLENNYILSPKDLSTVTFLDKILESGISLIKLEGRGRSPEYVKTITSVYRQALDLCIAGKFTPVLAKELEEKLKTVYNRGFWTGHYLGKSMADWNTEVYGSKATTKKIHIGKGLKYFKKIGIGEFLMESGTLSVKDPFYIIGPTTGVLQGVVSELRVDEGSVDTVTKGDVFSMPIDDIIRPSDILYIIHSNPDFREQ